MLPVEKIASNTMQNILLYVAVIGFLLVIATLIRLKFSLFRKAFIPASLLAGILGLISGPHVLNIIPTDMMSSIGALPGQMITIVFACMLLGVRTKSSGKTVSHDFLAGLGWLYTCSFLQVGIICLLGALLFTPLLGVNPLFGSVFEIGFAGGHGTAGGMVEVFKDLNWADGGDVSKTTATLGLMIGIFGGIAVINYGARKGYTKVITEPAGPRDSKEIFPEGEREAAAYATVSQDVVEPFALHMGVISIAILFGWLVIQAVKSAFNYSLPLFPFAMIGGWLLNAIIQRTSFKDLFDRAIFQRIQGMALEVLVVSAMASISIPVVLSYWLPLLLGAVAMTLMMLLLFFCLSPHIFTDNWFEHGIIRFGAFTGVAAVGYMLLRTADPKMETDAGTVYALGSPFMSPFIGGGLITTAYPLLINQFGALFCGLALCGSALVIILLLRIFLWIKTPQMKQH